MSRREQQAGQALLEVVVLAAAVVPLFLAIPLLAKYQDVRHAAIAASRTAAFECSVRPDHCLDGPMDAAVVADLRRRHFGRHERDLLSADPMADGSSYEDVNRFWVDRRGGNLLTRPSDVSLQVLAGTSDAARSAWGRSVTGAVGSGGVLGMTVAPGPGAFGLQLQAGLITAAVRAPVSRHRTLAHWLEKPEGMALTMTGRTAVMVDAWNASSGRGGEATSFRSRVERGWRLPGLGEAASVLGEAGRAAPGGALGSTQVADAEEAIDLLYAPIRSLISSPLMAPVEPRGSLFRYHEIDVDVVPADRLGAP